jgi:hypothetical protein
MRLAGIPPFHDDPSCATTSPRSDDLLSWRLSPYDDSHPRFPPDNFPSRQLLRATMTSLFDDFPSGRLPLWTASSVDGFLFGWLPLWTASFVDGFLSGRLPFRTASSLDGFLLRWLPSATDNLSSRPTLTYDDEPPSCTTPSLDETSFRRRHLLTTCPFRRLHFLTTSLFNDHFFDYFLSSRLPF